MPAEPRTTIAWIESVRSHAVSSWRVPITLMSWAACVLMPGRGRRRMLLCTTTSTPVSGRILIRSGSRMSASMNSIRSSGAVGGMRSMP